MGFFWLDFFFQIFFTLGSRITFFRLTYFRKRYVFKKEIIYLFFVCLFFSKGNFCFSFFFCKKYNQKLGGEKEIRDREKNGKMILNCRKKCVCFELETDFIPSKNLWFWVSAPWSSDFIIKIFFQELWLRKKTQIFKNEDNNKSQIFRYIFGTFVIYSSLIFFDKKWQLKKWNENQGGQLNKLFFFLDFFIFFFFQTTGSKAHMLNFVSIIP